jgi:hypothetical protein
VNATAGQHGERFATHYHELIALSAIRFAR